MSSKDIRIRLKSFDHALLDRTTFEIVRLAKSAGAKIKGAISLPRRIQRFTFNKSPHVNKKSREQFEIRTHKRLVIITNPTPQTIEVLTKITLAPGVDVQIN
ncbi:ribosomal protein S10 [Orientia chuto str. Dubai]|uniref:Small ribosomal subunit protein uS10 n=1 Tax=Orientia chuto str. Dubai TaxID=1359168 RepID=A0A0F3MHN6_9RICK|nr:30S ribosomal protein S10 [Candidatus Orientia mediorientalis]KJV55278.1 ribosomal protein S10 [Orientia chuto str. Dubai]